MKLSRRDRGLLDQAEAIPCETPDCPCVDWRRQLADLVTTHAPDVDREQLAVLLLKTAGYVTQISRAADLHGMEVGGVICGAAAKLAKEEQR